MQEKDMLFTVKQVSEILHCNPAYVYKLIHNKLLPVLKLGSYKVRKSALVEFLEKFEGYDVTDPSNIKVLDITNIADKNIAKVG